MSKKISLIALLAFFTILLTVVFFLPASYMAKWVEQSTQGRLSLGDVQGSFWKGSAFIGVASGVNAPITPMFPGRFNWQISPRLLMGQIQLSLKNEQVLSHELEVKGDFSQVMISPTQIILPSDRLEGLGAPFNTIKPSGKLQLGWNNFRIERVAQGLNFKGNMSVQLDDMSARVSPIKPLGSYRLNMDWQGTYANIDLQSVKGPLLLEGKGKLQQVQLEFSGKAYAQAGYEEQLASLLSLLGQKRQENNTTYIALEYR